MFKKESYSPTIYENSVSTRAHTSMKIVHAVSGLGAEEIVNNALQLDATLKESQTTLVFIGPDAYDSGLIKPKAVKQENLGDEVFPEGPPVILAFRLSKKTKSILGGPPSDKTIESALATYAGAAGHWFIGNDVVTDKFDTITTQLPRKVPTTKEPKYKGRHEKN